ncbi:hypothetical protein NXZ84_08005 [Mechercharimyces sp. CAU 1602]|nr:hypothetical protein [Mechercharimyces sp. CAU 1602]
MFHMILWMAMEEKCFELAVIGCFMIVLSFILAQVIGWIYVGIGLSTAN